MSTEDKKEIARLKKELKEKEAFSATLEELLERSFADHERLYDLCNKAVDIGNELARQRDNLLLKLLERKN